MEGLILESSHKNIHLLLERINRMHISNPRFEEMSIDRGLFSMDRTETFDEGPPT